MLSVNRHIDLSANFAASGAPVAVKRRAVNQSTKLKISLYIKFSSLKNVTLSKFIKERKVKKDFQKTNLILGS
jgi:hypothetical protein